MPTPSEERILDRAFDGYADLTKRLDRVVEAVETMNRTMLLALQTMNRNMLLAFVVFASLFAARDLYLLRVELPGLKITSQAEAATVEGK